MREESHLDDMRAAIRGDFERLEQRRGTQELMHVRELEPAVEPETEPAGAVVVAPEPMIEPEPGGAAAVTLEPEPRSTPGSEVEPVETDEASEPPARSWLARLLAAIPPRQV